jgi:hypothetical protein
MTKGTVEAVHELAGTKCWCGREKQARRTFCGACYWLLTPELREAIHRKLHEGYMEAYKACIAHIKGHTA